jgi:hypothetical protein
MALQIASGGVDGFVRTWDLRQRALLFEVLDLPRVPAWGPPNVCACEQARVRLQPCV